MDEDEFESEERGPAGPTAGRPGEVRAPSDVFVVRADGSLTLYRAGMVMAPEHAELPRLAAKRDASGAMQPAPAKPRKR